MNEPLYLNRAARRKLTAADLQAAYERGMREGCLYGSEDVLTTVYAAICRELGEAGNGKEEIYSFLTGVDQRVVSSVSGHEDLSSVMAEYGLKLEFKEPMERIQKEGD